MGRTPVIALALIAIAGTAFFAIDKKTGGTATAAASVANHSSPATSQTPAATNQSEVQPAGQNTAVSMRANQSEGIGLSRRRRLALQQSTSAGARSTDTASAPESTGTPAAVPSPVDNAQPVHNISSHARTVAERTDDIHFAPSRGIQEDYAVFFAQANLNAEEKQQFMAILSEERATSRDILELGKTTRLSNDEEIKLLRDNLAQTREELAAVLPAEKLTAYQDYRASMPYRNLIETVAALCAPEGETIAPATKEAVIKTLRATKSFAPYTSTVRNNRNLSQGDDSACMAVSHLLTPRQLEALRSTLAQRRSEAATQNTPAKQ